MKNLLDKVYKKTVNIVKKADENLAKHLPDKYLYGLFEPESDSPYVFVLFMRNSEKFVMTIKDNGDIYFTFDEMPLEYIQTYIPMSTIIQ